MRIIYFLVLASLLFVGYRLKDNLPKTLLATRTTSQPATRSTPLQLANQVDSFMIDATTLKTNEEGKPKIKMRMHSAYQLHNGEVLLNNPYIIAYNDVHNPPWKITARYGYIDNKTNRLRLKKNVKLTQRQGRSIHAQRILTTSELLIFPKRRYATTDKPVTMTEPDSRLHAVGLRANFKTDNIELLSHVKGNTKVKKNIIQNHDNNKDNTN